MRARVIEMETEKGFGKAMLATGETLTFDVSVSVLGVPEVGAEIEVEVGPARRGGLKITRAEILARWEATTVPCLCVRIRDAETASLIFLDGQHHARTDQPIQPGDRVVLGGTGQLIREHKRGAADFFASRSAGWSPCEIDDVTRRRLLEAFRHQLVDAWETWEDPDGSHTFEDLEELRTNVFAGQDLGLDVEDPLIVTAFPIELRRPATVHDMRAFSPPAASPAGKFRLTRPNAGSAG